MKPFVCGGKIRIDVCPKIERETSGLGRHLFIDEVFIKIHAQQYYLWRAVDQYGEVVDVFLKKRRDGNATKRFFKCLLYKHRGEPRKIVTDKLRSYGVAQRELIPETIHDTTQYANNRGRAIARAYTGEGVGHA